MDFPCTTHIYIEYLLLYASETARGSSGGPILKATKGRLEIVGLHRGGCQHYNYGSKFSEILLSISEKKDHKRQSKHHGINLIQNNQAVKKECGPEKGYGEKRCEIQGGGQEMAVIVG